VQFIAIIGRQAAFGSAAQAVAVAGHAGRVLARVTLARGAGMDHARVVFHVACACRLRGPSRGNGAHTDRHE
jgi:hypothetical protein